MSGGDGPEDVQEYGRDADPLMPPDAGVIDAASTDAPDLLLVLVTAPWAPPARPAARVLTELQRRWNPARVRALTVVSAPETLDLLDVDRVPTWIVLGPAAADAAHHDAHPRAVVSVGSQETGLRCQDVRGSTVQLRGEWLEHRRVVGAVPKHEIDKLVTCASWITEASDQRS